MSARAVPHGFWAHRPLIGRDSPDVPPDPDLAEARRIREEAIATRVATAAETEQRKSWFASTVRPVVDELRRRAELNGFGEEYTLSIQPKEHR